jgi:RHS repeat-associated protein
MEKNGCVKPGPGRDDLGGGFGSPFTFTGELRDANDLLYLRARYYSPALGVFPSLDPVENLNRYQYVGSNPANAADPSGMISKTLAEWDPCLRQEDVDCDECCSGPEFDFFHDPFRARKGLCMHGCREGDYTLCSSQYHPELPGFVPSGPPGSEPGKDPCVGAKGVNQEDVSFGPRSCEYPNYAWIAFWGYGPAHVRVDAWFIVYHDSQLDVWDDSWLPITPESEIPGDRVSQFVSIPARQNEEGIGALVVCSTQDVYQVIGGCNSKIMKDFYHNLYRALNLGLNYTPYNPPNQGSPSPN